MDVEIDQAEKRLETKIINEAEDIKQNIDLMIKRDIQTNNNEYVTGSLSYLKEDYKQRILEVETSFKSLLNQINSQVDQNHSFVNSDFNEKLEYLRTELEKFRSHQNEKFNDLEVMLNRFGLFIHSVEDKVNENTNNALNYIIT